MIEISHNFDPSKFIWLWSKYVTAFNQKQHCTNTIRGHYSRRLWKGNPRLSETARIVMDEYPPNTYYAIYVCGVAKQGYRDHKNYTHNVHAAVLPEPDSADRWEFEDWHMQVTGGRFLPIPGEDSLPAEYRLYPSEFTTCRIFRWAACYFNTPKFLD